MNSLDLMMAKRSGQLGAENSGCRDSFCWQYCTPLKNGQCSCVPTGLCHTTVVPGDPGWPGIFRSSGQIGDAFDDGSGNFFGPGGGSGGYAPESASCHWDGTAGQWLDASGQICSPTEEQWGDSFPSGSGGGGGGYTGPGGGAQGGGGNPNVWIQTPGGTYGSSNSPNYFGQIAALISQTLAGTLNHPTTQIGPAGNAVGGAQGGGLYGGGGLTQAQLLALQQGNAGLQNNTAGGFVNSIMTAIAKNPIPTLIIAALGVAYLAESPKRK